MREPYVFPPNVEGLLQGATVLCQSMDQTMATLRGMARYLGGYAAKLECHPDLGNGTNVARRFRKYAEAVNAIKLPGWRIGDV